MAAPMVKLDLLSYKNRLKMLKENGILKLFDRCRRKYVVADPEEWVRQLLLIFLIEERDFPAGRISIEKTVKVVKKNNRYDLLVFDKNSMPQVLVECKSPLVALNQSSINQIMRYNTTLQCPYIVLCNGTHFFMALVDFKEAKYHPFAEIPNYKELEEIKH
jgi:hypothetical protein